MSDFFGMGGYAAFVWPAYAVTILVLGGLLFQSLKRYRQRRRELDRLERRR